MNTSIHPGPSGPLTEAWLQLTAMITTILARSKTRRRQRVGRELLAQLGDRLRQDIGLDDSSPTPAELLERFYRLRQAPPREHELRFRPWSR